MNNTLTEEEKELLTRLGTKAASLTEEEAQAFKLVAFGMKLKELTKGGAE